MFVTYNLRSTSYNQVKKGKPMTLRSLTMKRNEDPREGLQSADRTRYDSESWRIQR